MSFFTKFLYEGLTISLKKVIAGLVMIFRLG